MIRELLALLESMSVNSATPPKSQEQVDKYSITLWGLPTELRKDYQQSILAQIAERIDSQHKGAVFLPRQLIEAQFFNLTIGKAVYRIRYEVRARRFIDALKTVKGAVDWMHASEMDPEVRLLTQSYLLRELQKEYCTLAPADSLRSGSTALVPAISSTDKSDITPFTLTSEVEGAQNDKERRAFPD